MRDLPARSKENSKENWKRGYNEQLLPPGLRFSGSPTTSEVLTLLERARLKQVALEFAVYPPSRVPGKAVHGKMYHQRPSATKLPSLLWERSCLLCQESGVGETILVAGMGGSWARLACSSRMCWNQHAKFFFPARSFYCPLGKASFISCTWQRNSILRVQILLYRAGKKGEFRNGGNKSVSGTGFKRFT